MENKKPIKISISFYNFLLRFGSNRVKSDMDIKNRNLCDLPDIIVKYFKENNDRYLELVNLEVENGTK